MSERTHLRNADLRVDIAAAVDIRDRERYVGGGAFTKADLQRTASELGDVPEDLTLEELYWWVCDQLGQNYTETAGCQWRLSRATLKAMHRELVDDA